MPFPPGGMRVSLNSPAIRELLEGEDGPVARHLATRAQRITKTAKRLAPVSPHGSHGRPSGYLRSHIGWELGRDAEGLYADIYTAATTPDGAPYGYFQEVGTRPHIIRSHGNYPLRNRRTGQVFGRVVHHPGTAAQPHLRPALAAERGR